MTAACDVPCVNNRAASNRRASNAALRRCPCCGVVMPQHRMVPDDNHHFISRDSLVPCQLTSPDQLSPRLTAEPFSSNRHVLGRRQLSTYDSLSPRLGPAPLTSNCHVRLGLPPPSGLVWLAIWPGTGTSPVPEFLQFGFMQRAFAAGAVMAVVCPLIGVFLVPRRLSLIADTLAHVALAGVAVGLLLGASPVLGALVVTVIGALGMERLRARGALQGDAALAVFLSGGFAVAVVLISLAHGFNADLFAILFGSILTVSPTDVWLILILGAVVVTTIALTYRRLFATTLNEDLARTSGVQVTALNFTLTVLTALTTVVAMRMVGVLLVSAMIVIPTLTGFAIGTSFRRATMVAIVMALASVGIGLTAAYYLRLAAAGAVVRPALLIFAVVSMLRRVPWTRRPRESRP